MLALIHISSKISWTVFVLLQKNSTKSMRMADYPKLLVIHLKRFEYVANKHMTVKLNTHFPVSMVSIYIKAIVCKKKILCFRTCHNWRLTTFLILFLFLFLFFCFCLFVVFLKTHFFFFCCKIELTPSNRRGWLHPPYGFLLVALKR